MYKRQDEKTVTVDVIAKDAATNGLFTVDYDAANLTLTNVSFNTQYPSHKDCLLYTSSRTYTAFIDRTEPVLSNVYFREDAETASASTVTVSADEKTVTVDVIAKDAATNGLFTVDYDADVYKRQVYAMMYVMRLGMYPFVVPEGYDTPSTSADKICVDLGGGNGISNLYYCLLYTSRPHKAHHHPPLYPQLHR